MFCRYILQITQQGPIESINFSDVKSSFSLFTCCNQSKRIRFGILGLVDRFIQ